MKIVDACNTYRNAEPEISERADSIDQTLFQIEKQFEYLNRHCKKLEPEFISRQDKLLIILTGKVTTATAKLDSLFNGNKINKLKYVFIKKNLDGLIKDLEEWQKKFDPVWYLSLKSLDSIREDDMRGAGRIMDTAKQIQVALSKKDPAGLERMIRYPLEEQHARWTDIRGTTARILKDKRTEPLYIVDALRCDQGPATEELLDDVKFLARKLHAVDSTRFGMLQCKAVQRIRNDVGAPRYELVFGFPERSAGVPTSLAELIGSTIQHSLTERIRVAQELTRAVCYVHALDMVHKNIRPASVLSFGQNELVLGSMYLIGFEMFRRRDGVTQLQGDLEWETNIYRHPERQGDHPRRKHTMEHDVYSLGVCLLEIGLWKPIKLLIEDAIRSGSNTHRNDRDPINSRQGQFKSIFEDLANTKLPPVMGDRYRDVVINCLTCLDPDNLEFADDSISADAKYIDRVCWHTISSDRLVLTSRSDSFCHRGNMVIVQFCQGSRIGQRSLFNVFRFTSFAITSLVRAMCLKI